MNNRAAFPFVEDGTNSGMTLREWYAGMALVGLLAWPGHGSPQLGPDEAAKEAFEHADAMLAEAKNRGDS